MRRKAASRGGALGRSAGCMVSQCCIEGLRNQGQALCEPGEPFFIGERARDDDKQAQIPAMRPQLLRLAEDGRPVDRNGDLRGRLVALVVDDLDLRLRQALQLVKGWIVAQILP